MRLPVHLYGYLARQFFISFGIVMAVLSALIILVDFIEILRRTANKDVPFWVVLDMVLLKFPLLAQKVMPFAILIGTVMVFTRLTRSNELIVARSSGVSVWQFLMPAVVSSFLLGVVVITIINPLSCAMLVKFESIEAKYIHGRTSLLAVSKSGLWLRQDNLESDGGEVLIHALRASNEEVKLYDVIALVKNQHNRFDQRIDAETAVLTNDYWQMEKAIVTKPYAKAQRYDSYQLPTNLTFEQIQESFAPPETISFWELPGFIDTLQEAGFNALRHQLHYQTLLVSPFFYAAMVLLASIFSLRLPRRGKVGVLIAGSMVAGFTVYFVNDLISALGLSGSLPIAVAAWTPMVIVVLTSVAVLLHLEDG